MDATVNDFLNEINEIAPLKEKKATECQWKQCFDEKTGFAYYWNVQSDEVTWEMPSEYKKWQDKNKSNKRPSLYIPPKTENLFPSVKLPVVSDNIKIYKIENESPEMKRPIDKRKPKSIDGFTNGAPKYARKFMKPASDSDEEKITLISSYGEDSTTDEEAEKAKLEPTELKVTPPKQEDAPSDSENEDDVDLLTKIQQRANELKQLEESKTPETSQKCLKPKKEISGFALVAGYSSGEDSDDQSNEPLASKTPPQSTLFPISEPIDIEQFSESVQSTPSETPVEETCVDVKAFQRKRRIGFDFTHVSKKAKDESEETSRQGFGYKGTVEYAGFVKSGVMFPKIDEVDEEKGPSDAKVGEEGEKDVLSKEMEDARVTLTEKLSFLIEGHAQVSPVQVLMIQIETLQSAMKDGSLKSSYFATWLKDTSTELVNLEKDAAPNGWLLQWDRYNKRYYYQNKVTGESQWDYPQPDITRCDEAMDISTTPPPPPVDDDRIIVETKQPPPPPKISSPTPPPPPVISARRKKGERHKKDEPPLPPSESLPPLPPQGVVDPGEPLPPGVDVSDISYPNSKKNKKCERVNDKLNFALDSFYSDLASISEEVPPPSPTVEVGAKPVVEEPVKKRKKTKVKLTQGLAMKKKGVSKLVEKWKNVQNSLD